MARRSIAWWEALPARRQVLGSIPVLTLVLFGIHEAFFPLLDWPRSLMYAVMEGIPAGFIVTFATQVELARRTERAAGDEPLE